ncbi:hypothetical protein VNO78_21652 [Psophocarpus tetragonolobus]|uniref:Uncharacterized protein n=1 Tax=Psophocarpus tetragonolobus TaxID=3891 RepID=A0AAN9SBC5_PSOTE
MSSTTVQLKNISDLAKLYLHHSHSVKQQTARKRKSGLLEDEDSSKLSKMDSLKDSNDFSTVGKTRDSLDRAFYKDLFGIFTFALANSLVIKIDLVPKEALEKWLMYLREELPTVAFKCSTQQQRSNLKSKMLPLGGRMKESKMLPLGGRMNICKIFKSVDSFNAVEIPSSCPLNLDEMMFENETQIKPTEQGEGPGNPAEVDESMEDDGSKRNRNSATSRQNEKLDTAAGMLNIKMR